MGVISVAQFERGDMWSVFGKTDMFLITTNPVINKAGLAVMGRGIAKQMADRYPEVREDFANTMQIIKTAGMWPCFCDSIGAYGYPKQPVGFFMVKDHWAAPAKPDVIKRAVDELCSWIIDTQYSRVDLNFPGIGNGKLSREDVLPLLEPLPDCVHIWEYDSGS